MDLSAECISVLEDMLLKAKAGELSSVFVISARKDVASGGIAYVQAGGNFQPDNEVFRDALRVTWQNGMRDFGWGKLQVDRNDIPPVFRRHTTS